ncbi:cellulose-binding domain-containing protein [Streptomyces actinomycinicus]|uniref:Cellulose-binding domain-containing protein n=1 Tax=Streptomyces actinomycinicus TaxID=1695166 RepID=A0A937JR31_9ACTN|nr:cellulose-binding domain-containing protein [Streptomyces actinomycinicus]MBL1084073.1 cellulose-binding domain-containing protein [Streptomyces actinomycinicus]
MPDLPTPQDDAEAALFAECWDAVLSYADLCTSGSLTAHQLATEAFTLGMREVRAAASTHVRGAGRRTARLPTVPALLTAVRGTAAEWEADGQGHKLDPDLRLWLHSENAARFAGPPLGRPIALRGLRDMQEQEADAALLWLAEVESLPLPTVARRLGLDPATAAGELDQVRTLFRDRCHRAHLDSPMDAQCRSYARLLDAVTRSPLAETPGDLSRHLATCVQCAEAAACLRLHGGGLPAALAGGVIGWGGLAYLERRRRATEVRLGTGRPGTEDPDTADPKEDAGRTRMLRRGLVATAVVLSALALGASLMPFDGSGGDTAAARDARQPVGDPELPGIDAAPARTTVPSATPSTSGTSRPPRGTKPGPEPQGTSSATRRAPRTSAPATTRTTACRVSYDLVSQWTDGFQATVTVVTDRALNGWQVSWTFRDGQQARQMWDATARQDGPHVTAFAADYDRTVAAHGTLSFGFIGSWTDANRDPSAFTLNGRPCASG